MTPRLSILICSITSRRAMLERLMSQLSPQLTDAVEVIVDCDAGETIIGTKRNRLVAKSNPLSGWVCFVDDDDAVSANYCAEILRALDGDPDCVGFNSRRFLDGRQVGDCSYSIRNRDVDDTIDYNEQFRHSFRTPGHLTPIRREFVLETGFEAWCYGEDRDFERRVFPLLKTESFIDANLYDYLLVSRERRGKETAHPDRWKLGKQRRTLVRA